MSDREWRVVVIDLVNGETIREIDFRDEETACDYAMLIRTGPSGLSASVESRVVSRGPWRGYHG